MQTCSYLYETAIFLRALRVSSSFRKMLFSKIPLAIGDAFTKPFNFSLSILAMANKKSPIVSSIVNFPLTSPSGFDKDCDHHSSLILNNA